MNDIGREILEKMLSGPQTIDEVIEFFKNYKIEGKAGFEPRFYRSNRFHFLVKELIQT